MTIDALFVVLLKLSVVAPRELSAKFPSDPHILYHGDLSIW